MKPEDLHIILDAVEEPVLLVDSERQITHTNRSAQTVLGETLPFDMIGQSFVRVMRNPEALRCIDRALDGEPRAQADIQLQAPHPSTFRLSAVHLGGSNPAVAVTLKDVTPLLQAAQMRSDFVANVSHELRSPLTTLSGIIETLQGAAKDDAAAQERFLAIMQREASRMDRLIGDLLSLSRVEADERIRPTERVDLVTIAYSVLVAMKERPEAAGRDIDFDVDNEHCFVLGDSDQLTQVFQNLLENAVKYSNPKGAVRIKIESRKSAPRFTSSVWAISVSDEGEGIEPEHIPRLQERFYRVDSGRSRQLGGTGLGLAIVKHILSRHRGRLQIASRPNEGVTMTVLLPAIT